MRASVDLKGGWRWLMLLAYGIFSKSALQQKIALRALVFPSPLPVFPSVMPEVEFEMWPFRAAHGWTDVVAVSISHTIPQGLPHFPNKQSFLEYHKLRKSQFSALSGGQFRSLH